MIRYGLAGLIAGALLAAATAAPARAEGEENRYQFNRVEDGYLRLDLKSGEVSLCSRRAAGWSCLAVPDDRAAFDAEIARLQGENAALKKTLLDRGLALPGGGAAAPTPAPNGDALRLPSDSDIDRAMAVVEKMWRRLVDMVTSLQRDLRNRT